MRGYGCFVYTDTNGLNGWHDKHEKKSWSGKVKKVFFDLFQKDESKIQDSYCTDNFFGSKMGLLPGDVVAYLYAVEKEFNLQIPSSYIQEGKFNTLDNVTNIICEVLQKKDD